MLFLLTGRLGVESGVTTASLGSPGYDGSLSRQTFLTGAGGDRCRRREAPTCSLLVFPVLALHPFTRTGGDASCLSCVTFWRGEGHRI